MNATKNRPSQRNYKFFGNKTTNFFAKVAENEATVQDYKKITRIFRLYSDKVDKEWAKTVFKQSAEIVFDI